MTCQGYKFVRVIDSVFESELPKLCGGVADANRDLAFEAKPNGDLVAFEVDPASKNADADGRTLPDWVLALRPAHRKDYVMFVGPNCWPTPPKLRRRRNVSAADTNKRKRLLKMKSDLQEQLARVEHELAHGSNSSS